MTNYRRDMNDRTVSLLRAIVDACPHLRVLAICEGGGSGHIKPELRQQDYTVKPNSKSISEYHPELNSKMASCVVPSYTKDWELGATGGRNAWVFAEEQVSAGWCGLQD